MSLRILQQQRQQKWDMRFLKLLKNEVSTWSKDRSTKTAAAFVSPDLTDVILGYNGFSSRMSDAPELYLDREKKYSRIIHCEMNALIHSKRSVRGYTLYTFPFISCDRCAVHVIEAGIVRHVAPIPSEDALSRWSDAFVRSKSYFAEAGVQVVEYYNDLI